MFRFSTTLVAGLLAAGIASAAPLQIDDFSLAQGPVTSTNNNLVTNVAATDGSFIGSTRTISTQSNGSGSPASQSSNVQIAAGVFEFASGVGVNGTGNLTYSGLGGLDLSAYTGFTFEDLSTDSVFDFEVDIFDSFGGVSVASGTFALPTPISGVNTFLAFSSFTGDADFSSVDSLLFQLGTGGATALDFSMSGISAAIPVPPAGVFLVSALAGLGLLRRRRS